MCEVSLLDPGGGVRPECPIHTVQFEGFVQLLERNAAEFEPHEALILIARCKSTCDEKAGTPPCGT